MDAATAGIDYEAHNEGEDTNCNESNKQSSSCLDWPIVGKQLLLEGAASSCFDLGNNFLFGLLCRFLGIHFILTRLDL
jgi:hypothetical protein